MFRPPLTTAHIILALLPTNFQSIACSFRGSHCIPYCSMPWKSSCRESTIALGQVIIMHFKAQVDLKSVAESSSLICIQMKFKGLWLESWVSICVWKKWYIWMTWYMWCDESSHPQSMDNGLLDEWSTQILRIFFYWMFEICLCMKPWWHE